MLVLSRKQKEELRIGNEITITVVRVKGKSVQLGISAPRSVRVVRGELPLEADLPEANLPDGQPDKRHTDKPSGEHKTASGDHKRASGERKLARGEHASVSLTGRQFDKPGPLAARLTAQVQLVDCLPTTT